MVIFPRVPLSLLAILALALLPGCETTAVNGGNPPIPAAASAAQLKPGDSLTVALQGVPDPSAHSVQIDEQGLISLPYIGPIAAANHTTSDLAQRIRDTYLNRKFYTSVDVSVSVTERYVYVGGEISRPGRIIWTPDLTIAKAIQSAGGFTLYAKETKVSLVRDQQAYDVNIKLAQKNPSQDVLLMPGDSIQVPRSPF
ncbi:MAG: polysaccharide export protein [Opitutaceae bacterium]|nr:polysaccharide export protein [Opitutaceae bacterium]MBP9914195.1 polysaccharide export protein [Opitutaceae bacterium]